MAHQKPLWVFSNKFEKGKLKTLLYRFHHPLRPSWEPLPSTRSRFVESALSEQDLDIPQVSLTGPLSRCKDGSGNLRLATGFHANTHRLSASDTANLLSVRKEPLSFRTLWSVFRCVHFRFWNLQSKVVPLPKWSL